MDQNISSVEPTEPAFVGAPVICFCHLRWDMVLQRPHHLMARMSHHRPVIFVEEPVFSGASRPHLKRRRIDLGAGNLIVVTPHLPAGTPARTEERVRRLISSFIAETSAPAPILWFYTPMALPFVDPRCASVRIYDCMDELACFDGAPAVLRTREGELLRVVDVVFTGGMSLYEAKRDRHANVHAFPSAVDFAHFAKARGRLPEPADQQGIPQPRFGFFGVIDERFDCGLVRAIAALRPDWHFVLLGPIVKIDPATLPRAANIHYLGAKPYGDLPSYVANWDVAIMPFARNAATRFISPTKTPEYLSCGRPVVSTPITDVVRSWGQLEGVRIAAEPENFVAEGITALALAGRPGSWLDQVDEKLAGISWDSTVAGMEAVIAAEAKRPSAMSSPVPALAPMTSSRDGLGEAHV